MNSPEIDLPGQVKALQGLQERLAGLAEEVWRASPFPESAAEPGPDVSTRLATGRCLMPDAPSPSPAAAELAARRLGELLEEALPQQRDELRSLRERLVDGDPVALVNLVLGDHARELLARIHAAKLPEDLAIFYAVLLGRPFRAWFAARLKSRVPPEAWSAGNCPICGHWPSLSLLDGKEEGRRYLWCLQCGTHWRHPRLRCAFCGNEDQALLTHHQIDGQEGYRLQGCRVCKRYLKEFRSLEARDQVPWDAVYLGTAELDLAALSLDLMRESPLIDHHGRGTPLGGVAAPAPEHTATA